MGAVYKNFNDFMTQEREAIISKWFHLMIDEYPDETVRAIKKEKDQFSNPVGHKIYKGIEEVYNMLLEKKDVQEINPLFDDLIRVKAVQDFAPSKAMGFIFVLKKIVRGHLEDKNQSEADYLGGLKQLDEKVENLGLKGFDIYTECRNKIYQLKVDELNRNYKMMQRATLGRNAEGIKKD
ncbi:hypothetical protein GGQ84_000654 [Desulfitispora alkaliphila]|uniref:RsbRD N-terminal domain-containing protein n=1 Tax=Desulfitispora alkaliphila TaxID=622674 RepID=UPI003D19A3B8